MIHKFRFGRKAAMTMTLKNSKQSPKPFPNPLGMFGVHTHQPTINCIQSCCSIHMLWLHNAILVVISMVSLLYMHNDQHGNDAEWNGGQSGPWFDYWPNGQLPISFGVIRNVYFHQCRSQSIFHIIFTRQFLSPCLRCHNMMFFWNLKNSKGPGHKQMLLLNT